MNELQKIWLNYKHTGCQENDWKIQLNSLLREQQTLMAKTSFASTIILPIAYGNGTNFKLFYFMALFPIPLICTYSAYKQQKLIHQLRYKFIKEKPTSNIISYINTQIKTISREEVKHTKKLAYAILMSIPSGALITENQLWLITSALILLTVSAVILSNAQRKECFCFDDQQQKQTKSTSPSGPKPSL